MKKDTFYILKRRIDGGWHSGTEFEEVHGYAVSNDYGLDLSVYKYDSGHGCSWNVTERHTGVWMGSAFTRSEAIKEVFDLIDKTGIDRINEAIEKNIERYGLSPLYKQENEEKEGGSENEGTHDEPAYDEVSEFF